MAKNKLSRDLKRYENMVLDEIKRIVRETAELLQQSARARAPVDTGDLKGSIEVVLDANGLGATVIVQKHYAIYIEYGTRRTCHRTRRKSREKNSLDVLQYALGAFRYNKRDEKTAILV